MDRRLGSGCVGSAAVGSEFWLVKVPGGTVVARVSLQRGRGVRARAEALPPQQKCPIMPPSALGERRESTFVAASEPHNDDVTPVMRVSTTTHHTQDSEQVAPMRG